MLMLSKSSAYAIRALSYLAMQPPGKLCGSREISEQEDIPSSFLCKILLDLRRKRMLRSYKGIGGGYELALPPDKINLLMIVQCIEGEMTLTECILEEGQCSVHGQCALHDSWVELRNQLMHFLETQTLANLVRTRLNQQSDPAEHKRLETSGFKDQSTSLSTKPSA
ncbi:MAG: Rrf2 family transcriptional regulator [Acidobacteria bacterium]|nr:MAG: Rrf2 family transcriptional regulator [Acidobacteriota bacterium]